MILIKLTQRDSQELKIPLYVNHAMLVAFRPSMHSMGMRLYTKWEAFEVLETCEEILELLALEREAVNMLLQQPGRRFNL